MATKERTPAFLFFPRQFAGDDVVQAMDLDAVGAHIVLMSSAAASPERCRIHADERAIRNRLRNPSEQDWQRIKKQLLAGAWKVSADGEWWEQDGLRRTFEKQKKLSEGQSEKANKRWADEYAVPVPDASRTDAASDAEPNTAAMPQECLAVAVASSVSNTESESNPKTSSSEQDSRSDQKKGSGSAVASEEGLQLALQLKELILGNNPKHRPIDDRQLRAWARDADLMMRKDRRSQSDIADLIRWTQTDSFEKCNVLSMGKVRDRFDNLTLKMGSRASNKPNGKSNHIGLTHIDHAAGTREMADGTHRF